MASWRFVDTGLERPRWRGTLTHRVLPTLQLGLEWNPAASEVGPLATWFVVTESETRPALFLGTSSDRIGSPPHTQSYSATLAKYAPVLRTSFHVSASWSEWEDAVTVPVGANIELGGGVLLQPMNDGRRTHLLATRAGDRASVSLIWAWLERAGAAVSFGF